MDVTTSAISRNTSPRSKMLARTVSFLSFSLKLLRFVIEFFLVIVICDGTRLKVLVCLLCFFLVLVVDGLQQFVESLEVPGAHTLRLIISPRVRGLGL